MNESSVIDEELGQGLSELSVEDESLLHCQDFMRQLGHRPAPCTHHHRQLGPGRCPTVGSGEDRWPQGKRARIYYNVFWDGISSFEPKKILTARIEKRSTLNSAGQETRPDTGQTSGQKEDCEGLNKLITKFVSFSLYLFKPSQVDRRYCKYSIIYLIE